MEARPPAQFSFEGNLSKNFKRFKQNFEIYLMASEKHTKPDETKIALLLSCMGEEAVEVFNTLKLSDEERKNYKRVMQEFEKYMNPKKNEVYERFKFFSRKQEEGENFDHFVKDLKKLASSCELTHKLIH